MMYPDQIDRTFRRRIDAIFAAHIWVCVPFSRLWTLFGVTFGSEPLPAREAGALRAMSLGILSYLLVRTYVTMFGRLSPRWAILWPLIDIVWLTTVLALLKYPYSPISLLYAVPIIYAAFMLTLWQSLLVGVLSAAGYIATGMAGELWTMAPSDLHPEAEHPATIVFRVFFLLLLASLVSFVGREAGRLRERLAVSEYQRELSAEMHDGIQHDLVLMARRLDLAEAVRADDPERAASIGVEQREAVRRVSDEIRFLVRDLRADEDTDADFNARFDKYLRSLGERAGIPVEVRWKGSEPIPPRCRHAALRIAQESITNAWKHADAATLTVSIDSREDGCELRVRDNGRGFDADTMEPGTGIGLMKSRAESLGGSCSVTSAPGEGTEVAAWLPSRPLGRKEKSRGTHPSRAD
jgi:signal transduction histidine kinase